ncbi:hypothetical protein [Weissella cibaria]|uniref:hypothetical protein n=1 Tax=Weissella cibaria TaxID=137591 RepID=UPI000BFFF781|nr:hypothetical protein [Weissella cibaria]
MTLNWLYKVVITIWSVLSIVQSVAADEGGVETMREFETAWNQDRPNQVIRLDGDVLNDTSTVLVTRRQSVTIVGDGHELSLTPIGQAQQRKTLHSTATVTLSHDFWLTGPGDQPLVRADQIVTSADSNVSITPGQNGTMFEANSILIQGQLALHGMGGDMFTANRIVLAKGAFVEAFGQLNAHVFRTASQQGEVLVEPEAILAISVMNRTTTDRICAPIGSNFKRITIQGGHVEVNTIGPGIYWSAGDDAMWRVTDQGTLRLTSTGQIPVLEKAVDGTGRGGVQVMPDSNFYVSGQGPSLIAFPKPTLLKVVRPATVQLTNRAGQPIFQRGLAMIDLQQINLRGRGIEIGEFQHTDVSQFRIKGRGKGMTDAQIGRPANDWLAQVSDLALTASLPKPAHEPVKMLVQAANFGDNHQKIYGEALAIAAQPRSGIITLLGSNLKSWVVQARLKQPLTHISTAHQLPNALRFNEVVLTGDYQNVLVGSGTGVRDLGATLQFEAYDLVRVGSYQAQVSLNLVAGPTN